MPIMWAEIRQFCAPFINRHLPQKASNFASEKLWQKSRAKIWRESCAKKSGENVNEIAPCSILYSIRKIFRTGLRNIE